jgi:A/G-specific adenine glycosylase
MTWHREKNRRQMPWKGEKDPYKIWLSEIILQQTRVEQGLKYYESFVHHFPDIKSLAGARDEKVFKLWEGLGYYSRCKNLLFTARRINDAYKGKFPSAFKEILSLKGVGPYTAAAIASFAFGLPYAVMDGNVMRVLSRYFGIETPIDSTTGKKQMQELAQALLDPADPAAYNQAMMDFGATVCKPQSPLCSQCPLRNNCRARKEDKTTLLPVKGKKLKTRQRFLLYFLLADEVYICIRKRPAGDIWENLHEFLLAEKEGFATENITAEVKKEMKRLGIASLPVKAISPVLSQKLTHQQVHAVFVTLLATKGFVVPNGYRKVPLKSLSRYAFPRLITRFLESR